MSNLPMNMKFTLILLVNQIKSGFRQSSLITLPNGEPDDVENFTDHAPPKRAVRAILDYAKALEVADTASIGKTEWILN
jgi:hypothetical protein